LEMLVEISERIDIGDAEGRVSLTVSVASRAQRRMDGAFVRQEIRGNLIGLLGERGDRHSEQSEYNKAYCARWFFHCLSLHEHLRGRGQGDVRLL
jgi:hypothetical protein